MRQRYNPSRCEKCRKPIVFMKNIHGNYVPCQAAKKVVNPGEGDAKIIGEDGIITTIGRRVGWPVHECKMVAQTTDKEK